MAFFTDSNGNPIDFNSIAPADRDQAIEDAVIDLLTVSEDVEVEDPTTGLVTTKTVVRPLNIFSYMSPIFSTFNDVSGVSRETILFKPTGRFTDKQNKLYET